MASENGRMKFIFGIVGAAIPIMFCIAAIFWFLAGIKSEVAVLQNEMKTLNGAIAAQMDDRFRRSDWDNELIKLNERFRDVKDRLKLLEQGNGK